MEEELKEEEEEEEESTKTHQVAPDGPRYRPVSFSLLFFSFFIFLDREIEGSKHRRECHDTPRILSNEQLHN